ncbi:hypothetical protein ACQ86N_30700 [Puia sp. P3]|uniref:hypothetical protein n=1 Tax=Puia sp. P3 TaxID=3423952 RepID=UPI003D67DD67
MEGIRYRIADELVCGSVEGAFDQLELAGIAGVGKYEAVVVAGMGFEDEGVGEGEVSAAGFYVE